MCLLRVICWIDELASARSIAADLNYDRFTHFDEMRNIGRFSLTASGGQGLECRRVKFLAVTGR